MPADYLPILILVAVAAGLGVLILVLSSAVPALVRGRRSNPARTVPYESGIRPLQSARRRVPVRFYLIAMLFIVFDIEVVFFYPWAVTFGTLRAAGGHREWLPFLLVEALVFIAILLVGYVYIWRKGAFDWE